jgi:dolichyl-diphosphooligosaccharide--protein glycosyltransferase
MDRKDDLTIDFSKVTRFFKKSPIDNKDKGERRAKEAPEHHPAEKPAKEELSLDWRGIKTFLIRHQALLLLLIPLFFSMFIRLQPLDFPVADRWAASTLDNAIRNQVAGQIDQQYPNLPAQNKEALVSKEIQDFRDANEQAYQSQKATIAGQLRDHFRDESGYFYMPDIDPYFYLRYARNIVEKGDVGDIVKDGKQWDNHGLAPLGGPVVHHIHPYALAWTYKVMHLFNGKITLMQAAGYFSVIISALAVIPIFFIGRRIAGNFGGFIAAMTMAVHVALVNRTIFGHADTDAYNVFFPLVILWLVIECHEAKGWRKKAALGAGAGLATGLFSWAWSGWWYIFDFILTAVGLYILYLAVKNRAHLRQIHRNESVRNSAMSLGIFVLASGVFVSLISNFKGFITSPLQPFSFIVLKVAAKANLWPNVYTTVAELNEASFSGIVGSMGGPFIMAVAALGILLILLGKDRKDEHWFYAFILAVWFLGTVYASTKGIRFTMLLVPPLALGLGVTAGRLYRWASGLAARELHVNKAITATVFCLAFLLLLGITPIPPFCSRGVCGASMNTAQNDVPIVNDAWYNALNKIRLESEPQAIINSWWDFGHHFKYLADRAVTFDGGSQNRPQAHWIGKVLLTADEKQAVAILRMLDCGANTAFERLEKFTGDTKKAVDLTYELLAVQEGEAMELLAARGMAEKDRDEIAKRMYCEPPEDYFITSDDMVGKAGVWAHFGSWNFERASIWINTNDKSLEDAVAFMQDELGYDLEKAEQTYFEVQSLGGEQQANSWIAPWPSYIANGGCSVASNDTLRCQLSVGGQQLQVKVDYKAMDVVFDKAQGNPRPKTFAYTDADGFHLREFNGTTLPHGLAIIREGDSIQAMLMAPELAGSMFTRLYFYKGLGLDHFRPFDAQSSFTGTRVLVWKVDWDGQQEGEDVATAPEE